jgi:peptidoglycan/LPS O-acetylase OafA/YrhL
MSQAASSSPDSLVRKVEPEPPGHRLPSHIFELDGIRAIAIWMVILLHTFVPDDESSIALSRLPKALLLIIGHGWLGVDLFFVLSGFLITGILLDNKYSPHYIRDFYAKRALRILPLYLVCLLVMAYFYPGNGSYFLLSVLFMANMAHLFGVPVPGGPGVFWSLAVEEHFYLIWPWLVRFFSRRVLALVCGVIIVTEPLLRAIFAARGVNVYLPSWFRFDGLASGALLAIWFRSPIQSARRSLLLAGGFLATISLVTIAALPFGVMSKTVAGEALRGTQATFVFDALMLAAIACRGAIWTSPLRSSFARLSADLSYCLYLIHLSIFDGYMVVFRRYVSHPLTMSDVFLRVLVVLAISFLLAMLSRRFLERPALSLKRFVTDSRPPKKMATSYSLR